MDKTSYEIWMAKHPKYYFLRIWECPAYVKQTVEDKLDGRSSLCYFVRYPKNSIGYILMIIKKQKLFVSRNVIFLEKEFLLDRNGRIIDLEEIQETPTPEIVEPTPQKPIEGSTSS